MKAMKVKYEAISGKGIAVKSESDLELRLAVVDQDNNVIEVDRDAKYGAMSAGIDFYREVLTSDGILRKLPII